jgi:hypothetical protein
MMLPTIAPMAVLLSVDEPGADVGPVEVELEVNEDSVDEPIDKDAVEEVSDSEEVSDNEEVTDGEGDVTDDRVGGKVEEGGVAGVWEGVGVTPVVLGDGVDTGGDSVVLGGGVGPP